jgi:hypothetical protein
MGTGLCLPPEGFCPPLPRHLSSQNPCGLPAGPPSLAAAPLLE